MNLKHFLLFKSFVWSLGGGWLYFLPLLCFFICVFYFVLLNNSFNLLPFSLDLSLYLCLFVCLSVCPQHCSAHCSDQFCLSVVCLLITSTPKELGVMQTHLSCFWHSDLTDRQTDRHTDTYTDRQTDRGFSNRWQLINKLINSECMTAVIITDGSRQILYSRKVQIQSCEKIRTPH